VSQWTRAAPPGVPEGIAEGVEEVAGVVPAAALEVTVGWALGLGPVPLGEPPHAAMAKIATNTAARFKCTR
jgi:hypothetical protein